MERKAIWMYDQHNSDQKVTDKIGIRTGDAVEDARSAARRAARVICRSAIALPIANPMIAPAIVSDVQCHPSAMRPRPIVVTYAYMAGSRSPSEYRRLKYDAHAIEFAMWPLRNECRLQTRPPGNEISRGSAVSCGRLR